jgi:nicotinamidase-related amidase
VPERVICPPEKTALVVIDMLNRYEHEDANPLKESVREIVPTLSDLVARAQRSKALVVYVNDNYGNWTAGRQEIVASALDGEEPGLVEPIIPPDDAPFVVKARHSAFYGTQLEYMLRSNEIEQLLLAGQVTEQCILYSALDAYVRHFDVAVPKDAVAHIHSGLADAALEMMETNMRAQIVSARDAFSTVEDAECVR